MMKSVLCFGDSLTWGFNPKTRGRYDYSDRWTGILDSLLGAEVRVIEEGLNARTTGFDDPVEWDRNGRKQLPCVLQSHVPLDLVIIFLGVNDLKPRLGLDAVDIASSASKLIDMTRSVAYSPGGGPPKLLLVCPPPLGGLSGTALVFRGAEEKSRQLAQHYRTAAESRGCAFLDAGEHVTPSETDGVHWDPAGNESFARALAPLVRELLDVEKRVGAN